MRELDTKSADHWLEPLQGGDVSDEHDAWLRAEIDKTLAKKKSGKLGYRTLDDVMQSFGFNARSSQ
ncbi:MAG: hypothetical protein JJ926_10545 [Roseitalea sp.]|jgi:hypothetical protein|uniref:Uncharacterized protein n=1 Tax=Oceaniradius stylonematis TaxID=2184161 RepID=A0A3A8A616_9HYPH|nr:hypothetical protein [Oceaniradius stylonematis]MBO6551310.1 hypothetical protein [Roseitalea sp.]MBO6952310.1 hypothetical protein [Rhizobiaceae bacterium]RNC90673.1 MAG: hypothetical protein ED558_16870 [Oricola sp.]MBO6591844.1 hypothetical protein [Roseitalea sp.]MBO6598099.1 hypothetical protein [Roseitalea sp.]